MLLVLAAHTALHGAGTPVPLASFFGTPRMAAPKLSPNGAHIAFLVPVGERNGLAVLDTATGQARTLVVTSDESIDNFVWKTDDLILYFADVEGNEAFATQMVRVSDGRITRLFESFGENNYTRQEGAMGGIAHLWPSNPNAIIYRGLREKDSRSMGFYQLDLRTFQRRTVPGISVAEQDRVMGVVFNSQGQIAARMLFEGGSLVLQAPDGRGTFRTIRAFPGDLLLAPSPDSFKLLSDDDSLLYIDFGRHDLGAIVQLSLRDPANEQVLFTATEGELVSFALNQEGTGIARVSWVTDRMHTQWLERADQRIQASVDRLLPGLQNNLIGSSEDRKLFLIQSYSDRQPPFYSLLDLRRSPPLMQPVGSWRPDFPVEAMRPQQPISFKARDGLEIRGFLTLPAGATEPPPMVLLPHGGPFGIFDMWGFDPEVQFLANRGFAVLQVNYRGSGGRGRAFLEAGRYEWGRRMQDDLTDAVQWAISSGHADPARVVIYGASYGGYAALWGAVSTPDLYRAAVNYVGVSDVGILGSRQRAYSRTFDDLFFRRWVARDTAEAAAISPVNFVQRIRIPTLHAYGENDPRVDINHWRKLKSQMDRHGVKYEYLRVGTEGHGFASEKNRIQFYSRLEAFLAKVTN